MPSPIITPAPAPKHLLLCVDVQPPFIAAIASGREMVRRWAFALEAAEGLALTVAFTEQVPDKLGGTTPELTGLAKHAVTWGKTTFSALSDFSIRAAIRALNPAHVLICGLETAICVYQTALAAKAEGYRVTVLSDAVGARREIDAQTALSALRHAGIEVLPSETVFYALLQDAKHPFFKAFTQLVKKYG